MLVVAGVLLLGLLFVDVFVTVFHAAGRGGPVTRGIMRAVWHLFGSTGTPKGRPRRDRLMGLAAPVIVIVGLGTWITLLVTGFALIYYRWIDSFLVSPGEMRMYWVEALYYSGYTAATLGTGDIVADNEFLRLLTPVEAFGGFALVSVSITYVLAIYREVVATQKLASLIHGFLRAVDPIGQEGARMEAVARWMEDVNGALLHVLSSHYEYPLLHYFRPSSVERALPPQLAKLDDLCRRLSSRDSAWVGHPSLLALGDSLDEYLSMTDRLFVPDSAEGRDHNGRDRRVAALLAHMKYEETDVSQKE